MRARSREVNIFNMSLLDILTGMLGAFLFLMLGLVPYYNKAQNKNNNSPSGPQTPPVDMTFSILSRLDKSAKVDFFIYGNGSWHGANRKSVPLSSRAKISDGACPATTAWAMSSVFANAGSRYLMCISPQEPVDPETLRTVRYSLEMLEAQSATDGSGIKSYYPDMMVSSYDASGAKPGAVYGVLWFDVTKDTTKGKSPDDYNLQYDFTYTAVKAGDQLPDGVVPLPPPAPVSAVVAPAPASAPGSAPAPDSAPSPSPDSSPTAAPASGTTTPDKSSFWNFFNWFHSAPAPPEQKPK